MTKAEEFDNLSIIPLVKWIQTQNVYFMYKL